MTIGVTTAQPRGPAAGAARLAAVCLLLAAVAPPAQAGQLKFRVELDPYKCHAITIPLDHMGFNYNVFATVARPLPAQCKEGDFRISGLYLGNTCTNNNLRLRSNPSRTTSSCASLGGGLVPEAGPLPPGVFPGNMSAACSRVFETANSQAYTLLPMPSMDYRFDSDRVCTTSRQGWLFVQTSCAFVGTISLDLRLVTQPNACGNPFTTWSRVGLGLGLIVVAMLAAVTFGLYRRRRRMAAHSGMPVGMIAMPAGQHPMAPAPAQPASYYANYGAPSYAAPVYSYPPPSPPPPYQAVAGAPQHGPAPVPMATATVVLGAPASGASGSNGGSLPKV